MTWVFVEVLVGMGLFRSVCKTLDT